MVPNLMSRHESINFVDLDRCSSDDHPEDTLPGYLHASRNRSPRFLTSLGHMRPFVARHLDKLSTERRPAGPRSIFCVRKLIYITLIFGAGVWLVPWAFQPLSSDVLHPPSQEPSQEPEPPGHPLSQELSPESQSNHATTIPPGIFDVCLSRRLMS